MRILVITLGSIGDLMPFLAVAEALRGRGHEVIIAGQAGYAALVQRAGFGFGVIWNGTPTDIDAALEQSPQTAWEMVRRDLFRPAVEPTAAFIRHAARNDDCAVLASWSAFGAPPVCAQMKLPLYRACLSPRAVDEAASQAQDGQWLGLFPDWFGPRGDGWPDIRFTGFPALDDALVPALEPKLEDFLQAGPAPIVFTPGSFQRRSSRFFRESLAACRALGRRAVLLTPYADQVPANLPDGVMHLAYAPLQRLAPRTAALVHHGGIGTLAQGLRSGVPQICAPVFFDQFDNAQRLESLGAGRTLGLRDYTASALAPLLQALDDRKVRQRAGAMRDRMAGEHPVETVCDLIGAARGSAATPA